MSRRRVLPLGYRSLWLRDICCCRRISCCCCLRPLRSCCCCRWTSGCCLLLAQNFLLLLLLLLLPHLSGRRVLPLGYWSLRLRDILLLRWLVLLPHLARSVVAPLVSRRLRRRVLGHTALRTATGWWLRSPDTAHIHHSNRCHRRRRTLANLLDFSDRKRAPGILRQRCLLPFKWHRRGRRRGSSDHRSAQHVGRRTRSARGGIRARPENAATLRRDSRGRHHLDRCKLGGRHRTRISCNLAAAGKRALRNRGHTVANIPVRILNIADLPVIRIPAVAVIVIDRGVIDHRVAVVDAREVALAHAVRRKIRFSGAQRKPAHGRRGADRETQTEARASSAPADPPHQRRSIQRSHTVRSRNPAPASAKRRPAAIVIGSESPGSFIHPGPAPRGDPGPMPVAIGRPVRVDGSGHPNLPVAGLLRPAAVLIEVVVAGDFARHVAGRLRLIFAAVARRAPLIEFVRAARRFQVVVDLIVASHHDALAARRPENLDRPRSLRLLRRAP